MTIIIISLIIAWILVSVFLCVIICMNSARFNMQLCVKCGKYYPPQEFQFAEYECDECFLMS